MLLGLDFMADRIIGIDFPGEQIYLSHRLRKKGSNVT